MRVLFGILAGIIVAGCVSANQSGNEDFNRYVEFCRETAVLADHPDLEVVFCCFSAGDKAVYESLLNLLHG